MAFFKRRFNRGRGGRSRMGRRIFGGMRRRSYGRRRRSYARPIIRGYRY